MDSDDDDAKEYYIEDSISDDLKMEKYKVLREKDIHKLQENDINRVCSLLSLPKSSACILLYNYKWNLESLFEAWFGDEERVRKSVGLVMNLGFRISSSESKEVTCGICFDMIIGNNQIIGSCDHMYCRTCWVSYISTAIDEGPGCLSLRCPDPSCAAAVGIDLVKLLVSDECKKKLGPYFVRSYVEGNRNVKWCPAPNCDRAIEYSGDGESGGYEVICDCSFKFCWCCIEEAHRPIDCDTVRKWILKNKSEASNVEWVLVYTKPCPKCKRAIEKNMGCMHMTCRSPCRHQFCWTCLGPWSSKHNCNAYRVQKAESESNNEEERRRQNAKQSLVRYTHYFERWDANHKSRIKAQSDLNKLQTVNLKELCDRCVQTKLQVKFVTEAWQQIIECRHTLKWSYAYGYFIPEKERAKATLFEYLQGQAEAGLERLHQCAEKELMEFLEDRTSTADKFNIFRAKLINLTSVTRNYFANLVTALENDLRESENEGKGKRKIRKHDREEKKKVTETAKTVTKQKTETLYGRLTALRDSEANITDALDDWVKEGKYVKRFDIVAYVNLLRKFKKYKQANQLYEWLEKSSGSKMNNTDRAIRVDLLAKTEGLESAENYFDSLQGSAKTKKTYGALLNCYCKEKVLDKALNLFQKMKELHLISTLSYNNMIYLYMRINRPEQVPLLTEEMEGKNIVFDVYTYNQLMKSYGCLKDLNAVEGVIEKMNTNKVKCDWFTLGNLAKIYIDEGALQKANATLGNMEKLDNLRDREAFHTLITLYAQTSNFAGVNRSWNSLKMVYPKPINASYFTLLLTLSKLGDLDALEKHYREWESDRSKYDVRVSNVILDAYLKRDMNEEAELIYENIVQSGAGPNIRTFESLTNYYIKKRSIDLAFKYLEMGAYKANSENLIKFPSDETIKLFLQYFEDENDVDKVEKFCNCMKMIDRLDPTVYDSLLCSNISVAN